MPTFNKKPGIGKRNGQIPFNAPRIGLRDVLQMVHRTDQKLLATLQDAPRRTNARSVLIETLRGVLGGHAYVDALQIPAAITVIESHEIDVPPAPLRRLEPRRDLLHDRQTRHIVHWQPVGN